MSRIGNKAIVIPDGVTINIDGDNLVKVKGPKGELQQQCDSELSIEQKDGAIIVKRPSEQKKHKAAHGLFRSLIDNMIVGVSQGYEKNLEMIGVGYKAEANGQLLELNVGFSHLIVFVLPPEIEVDTVTAKGKNPIISLKCIDKQLIGHFASKIRSSRPPEPYKGKGIRYVGEEVRRKAGKAAAKA